MTPVGIAQKIIFLAKRIASKKSAQKKCLTEQAFYTQQEERTAYFAIKNASKLAPPAKAAANQRGFLPRPVHVSSALALLR